MPSKKQAARQNALNLIASIREDQLKPLGGNLPTPFQCARNEVIKEINNYLTELENKLDRQTDQKTIEQTMGSLRVLSLTTSGFLFLNWSLVLMHDAGKLFTGKQRGEPELLAQLGKNILNTAKQYNALLDDSSRSLDRKVLIMLKAYTEAVIGGLAGLFEGMKKGLIEGEGLFETTSSMFQGAITGFWSGFFKSFSNAYERLLQASPEKELLQSINEQERGAITSAYKLRVDEVKQEGTEEPPQLLDPSNAL